MSLKPIYRDLVASIQNSIDSDDFKELRTSPRITSLSGLLRRHGLVLTCFFLDSKQGNDSLLLKLLDTSLKALPKPTTADLTVPKTLFTLKTHELIRLQEQALEASVWIQRLIAANKELEELKSESEGGKK